MASPSSDAAHNYVSPARPMTRKHPARNLFMVEDGILRSLDAPSFECDIKPKDCLINRTSGLSPHTSRWELGSSRPTKNTSPIFRQQKCLSSVYDLPDEVGDCKPPGRCTLTPGLFANSLKEFVECKQCSFLRDSNLDNWMDHLGSQHPLPSRWPSSKVNDGRADRRHPYTSVVDSHKKKKKNVIPRPLNSFMIFAQYIRRLTLHAYPDAPNVHISQRVGKLWRNLPSYLRDAYAHEARNLQDLHTIEFPDYKYRPRKRPRADITATETPAAVPAAPAQTPLTLRLDEIAYQIDPTSCQNPQNHPPTLHSPLAVQVDPLDSCSSPSLSRSSEYRPLDWCGDGFDEPGFHKNGSFNHEAYDPDSTLTSLINVKNGMFYDEFNSNRKRKMDSTTAGCGGCEDCITSTQSGNFGDKRFHALMPTVSPAIFSVNQVQAPILPPRPIKWDPEFDFLPDYSSQSNGLLDSFDAEAIKREAVAFEEKLMQSEEGPNSSMYCFHVASPSNQTESTPNHEPNSDHLDYSNSTQPDPPLPSIETWTFAKSSPPQ